MWRLAAMLVVFIGCAHSDPPAPSPMTWAFGNTLKLEVPGQGYTARRVINADGTWSEENTFGSSKGTWKMADGKVCYAQTVPAPDPGYERLCYDPTPRRVGDKWSNIDPITFNEVVITVLAGRN